MSKPIAVIISDVHYSVPTLALADAAMRQAIDKANELNILLIVAGDLHDTKANVRGECMIAMRKTFCKAKTSVVVLRGNHDALNEKSQEHSLCFLPLGCSVIDRPIKYNPGLMRHFEGNFEPYLIPYHHDPDELRQYLQTIPKGSTLIMHQGIEGSNAGDYIQDKSAINPADVAGMRVISGHYHTRQTIKLPDGGKWDYVGNPYSLNYGEANDPPKGFQILMDDGNLEFVPTNLRKHVVVEYDIDTDESKWSSGPIMAGGGINDLVWVKVRGKKETLINFNKVEFLKEKGLPQNVKFDLLPTGTEIAAISTTLAQGPLLDSLIDSLSNTSDERKQRLKQLWKGLVE